MDQATPWTAWFDSPESGQWLEPLKGLAATLSEQIGRSIDFLDLGHLDPRVVATAVPGTFEALRSSLPTRSDHAPVIVTLD